tara:strand:- start:1317 stop:2126 length:810 start_codon:yes stop_codon:yes gene_type:complete
MNFSHKKNRLIGWCISIVTHILLVIILYNLGIEFKDPPDPPESIIIELAESSGPSSITNTKQDHSESNTNNEEENNTDEFKVADNNIIEPKKNNANKTQEDNPEAPKENLSANKEDDSEIKEKQKKINELLKNNLNTDHSEKKIKDILNHLPTKSINNQGFYNGESNGYNYGTTGSKRSANIKKPTSKEITEDEITEYNTKYVYVSFTIEANGSITNPIVIDSLSKCESHHEKRAKEAARKSSFAIKEDGKKEKGYILYYFLLASENNR